MSVSELARMLLATIRVSSQPLSSTRGLTIRSSSQPLSSTRGLTIRSSFQLLDSTRGLTLKQKPPSTPRGRISFHPRVSARGFATKPHSTKSTPSSTPEPTPPSTPEPTISFKVSFDPNIVKKLRNEICYVIPFMSRPQVTIDENFMKTLEPNEKDSFFMVEKKKDLKQYFIKHMYEDYFVNWNKVFLGNAVKWFGILNYLNYCMTYNSYSADFFFFGTILNCIAAFATCVNTSITEGEVDYRKVCEYNKVKKICEQKDQVS